MSLFIDIIGWLGALLVLLAYALVSTNRVRAQSAVYQWLNIVGALGLVVNSGWNGAIPSAVVNLAWIGIGVYSLRQMNR
jgi:formate hydrogenlyase subunit 3/multisubunit Na+/H+ antiporter MnhD subunit